MTALDIADTLEAFLEGRAGKWDWDDFISLPIANERLEKIRSRCAQLDSEFPPDKPGHFCGENGLEILRAYFSVLRQPAASTPAHSIPNLFQKEDK
jgi:hypothetical protein